MARLQILELPEGSNDNRPPFVLVIDQVDDDSPLITDGPDIWPCFKNDTGCQHVIVTTETIDIPANDTSGYLATPAKQELVVNLSGNPDAIRDAITADMQKLRDANNPATTKPRRDWCCSLAFQTLGKQHIDDCRQGNPQP
ncbi:hypothetical protein ACFY9G_23420 [Streptomyces anthocyanicus]|uniref:hypothetical protein n=1 Tax=Streptomyces anthocyanicus TaxID=68174 RepID=UPI0036EBA1B6